MNPELLNRELSPETKKLVERLKRQLDVNEHWTDIPKTERVTLKDALTTADANILMPQVLTGMMREAAEPLYIGSKLMQTVRLTDGRSVIFPSIGAMRAHEIGESQSYVEETVDFQLHRSKEVKVGKFGMIVRVTEEMINDSQWDVIGILLRKAGEAMARLKEERIFLEFSQHGHKIFDNDQRQKYPELGTTGLDKEGHENNTLSTEDMIDMFIQLMAEGYNATDIVMHPLAWSVFFKNDILQSLSAAALGGSQITNLQIRPDTVQGRIPFAINLMFTPFAPFNYETRKFDMYVVDRNNVGVLLEKDPLSTEQFKDPERDIQAIKVRERYGVGVLNEGKAVSAACNLAFDKTYPDPTRVKVLA
jgi:hypothetical protein